jgi:hypothetical protein
MPPEDWTLDDYEAMLEQLEEEGYDTSMLTQGQALPGPPAGKLGKFLGGRRGSRAFRREAMRREGIPTSQQPRVQSSPRGIRDNQPAGRQLVYDTDDGEKLVQHQLRDRNHGPHWEAGAAKEGGQVDPAGRPRLRNDKTRVDEIPDE